MQLGPFFLGSSSFCLDSDPDSATLLLVDPIPPLKLETEVHFVSTPWGNVLKLSFQSETTAAHRVGKMSFFVPAACVFAASCCTVYSIF